MSSLTAKAPNASLTPVRAMTSSGGVEAWLVQSDVVPLIAMSFILEGGAAQDPSHKPGVAQMLARLLDEGAGDFNSDAFQERLAAHAIEMHFGATNDAMTGSLKTLVKHADEAFDLLRLALGRPRFDVDAIERVRAQTIAGLRYQQNDPNAVATRRFFSEAFGEHPYGHPISGTIESVSAITRDDIVSLHKALIAKGRVKIAIVGAVTESRVGAALDDIFADLPQAPSLLTIDHIDLQHRGERIVMDLDVPQSVIRFATGGIAFRDPDFIPAYVLNHILGGGAFTSRLFQEVREKRGLAYSVGTSLVSYRAASMTWGFTATKNERVGECISVIESEIARLRDEGPDEEELQKAKDYLVGSYALGFDTSTKIANTLSQLNFEGMGIDYITRRNDLVAQVSEADIRRAAKRTLGSGPLLTVVAGQPVF